MYETVQEVDEETITKKKHYTKETRSTEIAFPLYRWGSSLVTVGCASLPYLVQLLKTVEVHSHIQILTK